MMGMDGEKCFCLENEDIKKITGREIGSFAVGEEIEIPLKLKVMEVSQEEQPDYGEEKGSEMQMTGMPSMKKEEPKTKIVKEVKFKVVSSSVPDKGMFDRRTNRM